MSVILIKPRPKAVIVIETDSDNYLAASSGRKAFWSAFLTFNLAVMGSSVLPMPYALSHTGAAVGLLTVLLVALCNDYTTMLMVQAAYETGFDTYESLMLWVGGPKWKLFTQVTLIALLWVPNSGGLSLMGDVAQVMVNRAFNSSSEAGATAAAAAAVGPAAVHANTMDVGVRSAAAAGDNDFTLDYAAAAATGGAPGPFRSDLPESLGISSIVSSWLNFSELSWLVNGQTIMVLMTVLVVFPLSCQKHMRSLEGAAAAGVVVVAALCCLLGYKALQAGLPAVASGEFPLWNFKVTDNLPEAFALLGFAFYLQPLMMPVIREMPEGKTGRRALTAAVHTSLLGSSFLLYAFTGLFGAALFGQHTASNILVNHITDSTLGCLVVYSCMLMYLAAGAAACQYPLRASLDILLVGEHVPMTTGRSVVINAVTLSVSLVVALLTPGGAAKVYALVGATGVCIVCYVLPVVIHMKLLHVQDRGKRRQSQVSGGSSARYHDLEQMLSAPLLSPHSSASSLTHLAAAAAATAPNSSGGSSSYSTSSANGAINSHAGAGTSSLQLPGRPFTRYNQLLSGLPMWLQMAVRLLVPVTVMLIGIGFSLAAIWVAIMDIVYADEGM